MLDSLYSLSPFFNLKLYIDLSDVRDKKDRYFR